MTAEALLSEAYDVLDNILKQQMAQDEAQFAAWLQVEDMLGKIEDFRVDGDEGAGMKRFIDLRGQYTGCRFAWWDTVRDEFESFAGEQAWDTWDEFAEGCPPAILERYRRLCPQWALEAEREAPVIITDAPLPPLGPGAWAPA